ncbi:MAG: hypothetical protein AAFR21_11495 [Pseudomonadota bacterium]
MTDPTSLNSRDGMPGVKASDPTGPNSVASDSKRPSLRFFLICSGLLLAVMAAFPILFPLEIFHSNPHIIFAMFLGVFFTIVLGVGLMALAFYSARSGMDDSTIDLDEMLQPQADHRDV